ncbi:MAG TPA: polyprenyl synthetase family protein [Candidatus Baltobacteraceae bacterium]|nr:polyprenyl synthetase family protein [Candidatus Baltobacteraceae bacterium]
MRSLTPQPAYADVEPLLLSRHRSAIAAYMHRMRAPAGALSGKMLSYHMGWSDEAGRPLQVKTGKLIRPALCLWAAAACGSEPDAALPAAAAVEWFHNFTLVHDDIQDGDRRRHGRETVWSIWGVAQGINTGDAMHALAFLSLASSGADPARALAAIRAVGEAGLQVIEGQCLDMALEGRTEAALRDYLRMVNAKTGALLGGALEAGALLGGAEPQRARLFRLAGRLLGTAFQIQDDALGIFGDPSVTGKSASGDADRQKMTYPVIAGMSAASPAQRRRLRDIFRIPSEETGTNLRTVLEEIGCDRITRATAQRYAQKAVAAAARAGIPRTAIDEFEEVAYYVATRNR